MQTLFPTQRPGRPREPSAHPDSFWDSQAAAGTSRESRPRLQLLLRPPQESDRSGVCGGGGEASPWKACPPLGQTLFRHSLPPGPRVARLLSSPCRQGHPPRHPSPPPPVPARWSRACNAVGAPGGQDSAFRGPGTPARESAVGGGAGSALGAGRGRGASEVPRAPNPGPFISCRTEDCTPQCAFPSRPRKGGAPPRPRVPLLHSPT